MNTPQWVTTISLALEIPFDSKEEDIWSNLISKHSKFADIFITTLQTIDIVRLPFIDYSFIKWFSNYQNKSQEAIFSSIQQEFQAHLRKRVLQELLSLEESDQVAFLKNLSKLYEKVNNLSNKNTNIHDLQRITEFLDELNLEIKELEENEANDNSESKS